VDGRSAALTASISLPLRLLSKSPLAEADQAASGRSAPPVSGPGNCNATDLVGQANLMSEVFDPKGVARPRKVIATGCECCNHPPGEQRLPPGADVTEHIRLGQHPLGLGGGHTDTTVIPTSCSSAAMSLVSWCRAAFPTEYGRTTLEVGVFGAPAT
jgi:hypothetical protein